MLTNLRLVLSSQQPGEPRRSSSRRISPPPIIHKMPISGGWKRNRMREVPGLPNYGILWLSFSVWGVSLFTAKFTGFWDYAGILNASRHLTICTI